MAAVAFVPPTSSIHCIQTNEGLMDEMFDSNVSFYLDSSWTNAMKRGLLDPGSLGSSSSRAPTCATDQPTVSTMRRLPPGNTTALPPPTLPTSCIANLLPDDVNLDSWQKVCPEQWTCDDVLNLIYFIAMQSNDIEFATFQGEKFQDVNGSELCLMTEDEYIQRDPKYGKMLYGCIRDLLQQSQFYPPDDLPVNVKQETVEIQSSTIRTDIPISVEEMSFDEQDLRIQPNHVNIFGMPYDIDPSTNFHHIQATQVINTTRINDTQHSRLTNENRFSLSHGSASHQLQQYHYPTSLSHQHQHHHQHQQQQHPTPSGSTCIVTPDRDSCDKDDFIWSNEFLGAGGPQRQSTQLLARDPSVSSDDESSSGGSSGNGCGKVRSGATTTVVVNTTSSGTNFVGSPQDEVIVGRSMNGGKGNHLWEFLCQQLRRSENIPTKDKIIQWESREDGVFRILDSKEVATQWGLFKGNEKMTYEKLSRALRWCRTYGFLATLPKDGKFPKKLCFRFGPRATNWRNFL